VTLLDGGELEKMIRQARGASSSHAGLVAPTAAAVAGPECPACGSGMLERTAKRGVNAGKTFWGCAAYPSCKGTAPAQD
jgi:restriction system protein